MGRGGGAFCFVSFIAERDAMLQRRRGSSCERSSAAALAVDPPQMPSQSVQGSICSMAQVHREAKEIERERESICLALVVERNSQRDGQMPILEQDESWTREVGGPQHVDSSLRRNQYVANQYVLQ